MSAPQVSVDPVTGDVVIHMDRGDVLVSRTQLEAVMALASPKAVTIALSDAQRKAKLGQTWCHLVQQGRCDSPVSVARDERGFPRCWDHQKEAEDAYEQALGRPYPNRVTS